MKWETGAKGQDASRNSQNVSEVTKELAGALKADCSEVLSQCMTKLPLYVGNTFVGPGGSRVIIIYRNIVRLSRIFPNSAIFQNVITPANEPHREYTDTYNRPLARGLRCSRRV